MAMRDGTPVLCGESLNQIWAWRGTGKTNFALGLTRALANGTGFLRWQAQRPCKVLYVEGEIPGAPFQQRNRHLIGPSAPAGNIRLISLYGQIEHQIPPLASEYGQRLLEEQLRMRTC